MDELSILAKKSHSNSIGKLCSRSLQGNSRLDFLNDVHKHLDELPILAEKSHSNSRLCSRSLQGSSRLDFLNDAHEH